ncbi:MAG: hypothetical protein H0X17_19730, partial [Deltaproteobacteria bacterium]|nr:hypothetical protein [Deltaproteobacteria bacterium]
MQVPRLSRRWWIAGAVTLGACLVLVIGLLVVYPRLGASMIREQVSAKVASKLAREVTFGAIDVSLGHAVLRDVVIRGPNDGDTPLVHVDRIDIAFDAWKSLVGSVELGDATIDGVIVTLRRGADGKDNVSDIVERVRADRAQPGADGGGGRSRLPTSIKVTRGRLLA